MEDRRCCFCDRDLIKDLTLVKTQGLQTVIEISKTIKDGLREKLENIQEIKVNEACRNYYTKPSTITSKKRELNKMKCQFLTENCPKIEESAYQWYKP